MALPADRRWHVPAVNPLAGFIGQDSTGTWTLTVTDNADQDVGQLQSWALEICIEQRDPIFADGFESGNTSSWTNTLP
ncbi:MAG: hypothetical protein HC897_08820 [Thermoanaerobaculia bacterium]|nr:hypothetical protein [Thermoanaerobaculia bacterium]